MSDHGVTEQLNRALNLVRFAYDSQALAGNEPWMAEARDLFATPEATQRPVEAGVMATFDGEKYMPVVDGVDVIAAAIQRARAGALRDAVKVVRAMRGAADADEPEATWVVDEAAAAIERLAAGDAADEPSNGAETTKGGTT